MPNLLDQLDQLSPKDNTTSSTSSEFNPFSILLPYQKKIFLDQNPFIIAKMSRQSGKSFTVSAKAVYNSIIIQGNLTIIVSASQRSADEFLLKCKQWAEACKLSLPDIVSYEENATEIRFNNKSRIISLPANPASLRGYSGDVILDEFALVENDHEIFQAILPVITSKMGSPRQHSLTVLSTPTTEDTDFARIWFDTSGKWSKYSLTIYDAVKQGLKADPEMLKQIVADDEIWRIEYLVEFSSGAATAFPPEQLRDIAFDDELGDNNSNNNNSNSNNNSNNNNNNSKRRSYFLGYDVARRGDFSVLAILFEEDGIIYVDSIIKMKGMPYNQQMQKVRESNNIWHFSAGYTDAVGIGSMVAEEINRTISHKICPFSWNSVNKPQLYDRLRTIIADGRLKVRRQFVDEVKADFAQVKRYVSSVGRISYAAPHTADGHSDITSAICLALEAMHHNPVSFDFIRPYVRQSVF